MPNGKATLQRHLRRSFSLSLLGASAALLIGAWLLLLKPSLDGTAALRADRIADSLQSRLQHQVEDSLRLFQTAADWLRGDDLTLDHGALNRRFMPLLRNYKGFSSLRVADSAGSEWMLFRRSDGTWLNRLTKADDSEPYRRFLTWSDSEELLKDERLESDYAPRRRPWFRAAHRAQPGVAVWSEIRRLPTSHEPGITVATRIVTQSAAELVLALDLDLGNLAAEPATSLPGSGSQVALLTQEGRLLGIAGTSGGVAEETLEPVIGLNLQPMKMAFEQWLGRSGQTTFERYLWHDGDIRHVAFRRLALGDSHLWLVTFQPLSELVPDLRTRLLALAALLLTVLLGVLALTRVTARELSRPLDTLTDGCRRIARLDFTPTPILPRGPREVRLLADAQEAMRERLADLYDSRAVPIPAPSHNQASVTGIDDEDQNPGS
jgi:hypothetical protein